MTYKEIDEIKVLEEEYSNQMDGYAGMDDKETSHILADGALMEFLDAIGCTKLMNAYDKVGKWYA